jgi:hypothetical protein
LVVLINTGAKILASIFSYSKVILCLNLSLIIIFRGAHLKSVC